MAFQYVDKNSVTHTIGQVDATWTNPRYLKYMGTDSKTHNILMMSTSAPAPNRLNVKSTDNKTYIPATIAESRCTYWATYANSANPVMSSSMEGIGEVWYTYRTTQVYNSSKTTGYNHTVTMTYSQKGTSKMSNLGLMWGTGSAAATKGQWNTKKGITGTKSSVFVLRNQTSYAWWGKSRLYTSYTMTSSRVSTKTYTSTNTVATQAAGSSGSTGSYYLGASSSRKIITKTVLVGTRTSSQYSHGNTANTGGNYPQIASQYCRTYRTSHLQTQNPSGWLIYSLACAIVPGKYSMTSSTRGKEGIGGHWTEARVSVTPIKTCTDVLITQKLVDAG